MVWASEVNDWCKARILGILLGNKMIIVVNRYSAGKEVFFLKRFKLCWGKDKFLKHERSTLLGINIG